jgi:Zn-dependent protease with chaperone function
VISIEFDFPRYIAQRKGEVEQRARDGAAYAFSGERKLRRALVSAKPVAIAIEATTRLWKSKARRELLSRSQKASDRTHAPLYDAARAAGRALGVEPPAVVVPEGDFPVPSATLGTDEEPIIVVSRAAAARLDQRELVALLGHELGHVQNNHVFFATALFYLRHEAFFFVRWIVQPAILALSSWSRRAEITCDRAALIAVRDVDVALSSMVRVALGDGATDARAALAELAQARRGVGVVADLFRGHPHLVKRASALEVFADSALYRKLAGRAGPGGLSGEEVDTKVSEIVKVWS